MATYLLLTTGLLLQDRVNRKSTSVTTAAVSAIVFSVSVTTPVATIRTAKLFGLQVHRTYRIYFKYWDTLST